MKVAASFLAAVLIAVFTSFPLTRRRLCRTMTAVAAAPLTAMALGTITTRSLV